MSTPKKSKTFIYLASVGLFLLALFTVFNSNGYIKQSELNGEINDLRLELDTIKNQNRRLREQIDSLQKQYDAKIEQVAREKHGMKKENEKIIKVEKK
jgi:cell division protein FtsL